MAGIDKIYGTPAQAKELRDWLQRHRPKAVAYTVSPEYLMDCPADKIVPISNFPCGIDKWLARHCPLPFVLERLSFQHGNSKTGAIARQRLEKEPRP